MKKKLKAFTLIELIIVIAILGIMMTAIMRMFEPVTNIYNTTAVVSNQRTAEQGIATYIAENTRYATSIGVFQKQNSASDAVTKFLASNPTDANGVPLTKSDLEIICINHSTGYTYMNNTYSGRIIRKVSGASSFSEAYGSFTPDGSGSSYMALGEAYYGPADYYIRIKNFSASGFDIVIDSDYYGKAASKTDKFLRGDEETNYTKKHVTLVNTGTADIDSDHTMVRSLIVDETDESLGTRTSTSNKSTYIVYSLK